MVGMKNYLSSIFTGIPPHTPHSHAPVEFQRISDYKLPCIITVSTVNYRQRGLNENLGITYLTIVLMFCKILMRYV